MIVRVVLPMLFTIVLTMSCAVAAPALEAAATAKIGSEVPVTVTGSDNPRDFVGIVPKGLREGGYEDYQYVAKPGAQPSVIKLRAPATPGDYEIRLLGAQSPYPTLARRPLKIEAVTATLDAPAQVAAGATFEVKWTGPNNERDFIGIGEIGPQGQKYLTYDYATKSSPIKLTAPDKAGEYELRYFLGVGYTIIGTRKITVGSVSASVSAPAQVVAGKSFKIEWQGPNNPRDFITLVKAGTADKQYDAYAYTAKGSPVELRAPDIAGDYEVRYLTAQSYATLATAKVAVTAVNGSVQGPTEAIAGSSIPVNWKGPNNANDYITILPQGAKDGTYGNYAYTARGNPVSLLAPIAPGDYELRYNMGQSHVTLARASIRIAPGKQEPGLIVASVNSATPGGNAVEIILDASGSMLQRIGSQRRIDIAKQSLTKLTSATLPAGTPFALRVFGREVDSCQTDLDIPLTPLNAAAVATKINALESKNNARTPIGASLEKVVDDLATVKGERLVILLTDGEETCGGDPAAAIEKLKRAGVSTRVNIVGFAIDDAKLEATFRLWSEAGNGSYFNAKDAAGLAAAMTQAMRPGFEVVNAQGQVVASGLTGVDPVKVMPGNYTVRLKGQAAKPQTISVKPKETTTVSF
jgi:hypothetical protein